MAHIQSFPCPIHHTRNAAVSARPSKTMLHLSVSRPSNLAAVCRVISDEVRHTFSISLFALLTLCSMVLFAGDLVLNIHNPATDAIPVGTRIALAFLSAAAVRSAGFQGVPVASLTPAVQCVSTLYRKVCIRTHRRVYEQSAIHHHDVHRNLSHSDEVSVPSRCSGIYNNNHGSVSVLRMSTKRNPWACTAQKTSCRNPRTTT